MDEQKRRTTRTVALEPACHVHNAAYTGESDAHQALEHILDAVEELVCMVATRPDIDKRACLHHLRQAVRWLRTARVADLDRDARWSMAQRLELCLAILDRWGMDDSEQVQLKDGVERAFQMLNDLSFRLYRFSADHVERLYEARHISRWEQDRLLHPEDDLPLITQESLTRTVRRLHSIVASLPIGNDEAP